MEQNEILLRILQELADLKKLITKPSPVSTISDKWASVSEVMKFFGYGQTQLASLLKNDDLIVSKIGKRKFVLRKSLEDFIEKNIQDKK